MKNNITKLILLFTLTTLSLSCSDFLKVDPPGKTTTPVAFSDIKGMRSALSGTYSKVFDYYSSYAYVYADLTANTINLNVDKANTTVVNYYNYNYQEIFQRAGNWGAAYSLLTNINNIILYQPALLKKNPNFEDELNGIYGEALFLRALSHFNLCNMYAQPYNYTVDASHPGIVIALKPIGGTEKPARSSVKDVYKTIVDDLLEAEKSLNKRDRSRINKTNYYAGKRAVCALLSRVYLYMENWEESIKYSNYVIDEVALAKGDDYLRMYQTTKSELNYNTELIFQLNGDLISASSLITLFTPTIDDKGTVSHPSAQIDNSLGSLFNNMDDIRSRSLVNRLSNPSGGEFMYTNKFNVSDKDMSYPHFNPILFRVSEMYLNRAEAYLNINKLSEAGADVKAILDRAYHPNANPIVIPNSEDALKKLIEDERLKELCFEGHALYDIVRQKKDMVRPLNTTSSIQKLSYPNELFVLPIPRREIDINENMVGNPLVND